MMPTPQLDTDGFLLIEAKLRWPELPRELVSRSRLRARLHSCLGHKLILLSAPAGFGKTTLLAECAADSPHPVAWLSLDKGESDPSSFLSYLVAAVQTVYPASCSNLSDMLIAQRLPSQRRLSISLAREIARLPGDLVLVLDDYQTIQDEAVHQVLWRLLRNAPPQFHLVIATRQDPPLPLARLQVGQQMVEFRADDLRFTPDEAQSFFEKATEGALDREAAAVLQDRTEGWIGGLYLAALSLRGATDPTALVASFHGASRLVTDYFVEEVLSHQPAFIQSFLLRTSILDRFCAPLCDAVLDGDRSTEKEGSGSSNHHTSSYQIMEALEQANLFVVPLDNEKAWYRYHHLFQEALRGKLQAECSQEETSLLHTRAMAWLAEHGLMEEAMHHGRSTSDVNVAVRFIEDNAYPLLHHESWPTLDRWLRMLPYDVIQQHPSLLLAEAWLLGRQFKIDASLSLLDRAETLLDNGAVADETAERVWRGKIAAFRAEQYYWQGQANLCLESAVRALESLPAQYRGARARSISYAGQAHQMMGQVEEAERLLNDFLSTEARNDAYLRTRALLSLSAIYRKAADLVRLDQFARLLLELAEEHGFLDALSWAHHWLGVVEYEWNDLDAAERHFLRVLGARHVAHAAAIHSSMLSLALVYQAQQKPTQANQVVEECLDFALETSNTLHQTEANAFRARLSLMRGHIEPAANWLQRSTLPDLFPVPRISAGAPSLTKLWTLIAQGTPGSLQEGSELLDRVLDRARTHHNTLETIKVLALKALAQEAEAQREQALATLEESITLARPGNFIRTFVDLGPAMKDLLSQLAKQGVAPEYLGRLLNAFPEPAEADGPASTGRPATVSSDASPVARPPAPGQGRSPGLSRTRRAGSTQPVVLIIDDDEELASLLSEMLGEEGYQFLFASDGVEGLQMLQAREPDLVVLDILMPRMDGWETCRRIREISDVPIILLTCRTDGADEVRGLNLGADDYIAKLIHREEFAARARAVLRRSGRPDGMQGPVQVDDRLTIDRSQAVVLVEGQAVDLSATEYKLLLCLHDNAGRICTRQSLLTQVWGWEYADEPGYLKVYIHHLRQKIEEDPRTPRYITTERGLGYRFQASHNLNPV